MGETEQRKTMLLVGTPVKEIRGFDDFHVHIAYRSPERLVDTDELDKNKAEVYRARYENFREGLHLELRYIDAQSLESLMGVTFAFVCVDKCKSRAGIFELLISNKIPFIDVGMGLSRTHGPNRWHTESNILFSGRWLEGAGFKKLAGAHFRIVAFWL